MCFTLLGRLQTRLFSLCWPLCATLLFATWQQRNDYWMLFSLMTVSAFALDVGVYVWLIRYQPRWLTIGLGVFEFWVIQQFSTRLGVNVIQLRLDEALGFYVVAWLGAWITTQAVLPWLWPRWAEDGGEIRHLASPVHTTREAHNRRVMVTMYWLMLAVGALLGYTARPLVEIISALAQPQPVTLMKTLTAHTRHFKGEANAPVTIIEISDFQCVECARFAVDTAYKLDQTYVASGIVRYGQLHFAQTPYAQRLAEASECAHEQGGFWVYYRRLFDQLMVEPSRELNEDELTQLAVASQLDAPTFAGCLASGRQRLWSLADQNTVSLFNLSSAPTFWVNGRLISGALSFEAWQQLIESERSRSR